MPFVHIKSLPFEREFDVEKTIRVLSRKIPLHTEVKLKHLSMSWEFFAPGHYAVAGKVSEVQTCDSHPIIVELIAPDLYSEQQIEVMLRVVAEELADISGIPEDNIFIQYREAHSGRVFDDGSVRQWSVK